MTTDPQPDLFASPQAADSGGRLDLAVPESLRPVMRLGTCSWKWCLKKLCMITVATMLLLFLTGCATLWGPSKASRALAGALADKEIDETTRQRVVQDQPLTIEDIKALARANMADDLIIGHINATSTFYRLGTAQILDLSSAGVSEKLIDYMIAIPIVYAFPPPFPDSGYHFWYPYPNWRYGHHRWH